MASWNATAKSISSAQAHLSTVGSSRNKRLNFVKRIGTFSNWVDQHRHLNVWGRKGGIALNGLDKKVPSAVPKQQQYKRS